MTQNSVHPNISPLAPSSSSSFSPLVASNHVNHLLPVEILTNIFKDLDHQTLFACSLVCWTWSLTASPLVWKSILISRDGPAERIVVSPALGRYRTENLDIGPFDNPNVGLQIVQGVKGVKTLTLYALDAVEEDVLSAASLSGVQELILENSILLYPSDPSFTPSFAATLTKLSLVLERDGEFDLPDLGPDGTRHLHSFPTPSLTQLAINLASHHNALSGIIEGLVQSSVTTLVHFTCQTPLPLSCIPLFAQATQLVHLELGEFSYVPFWVFLILPDPSILKFLDVSHDSYYNADEDYTESLFKFIGWICAIKQRLAEECSKLKAFRVNLCGKHLDTEDVAEKWIELTEDLQSKGIPLETDLWKVYW